MVITITALANPVDAPDESRRRRELLTTVKTIILGHETTSHHWQIAQAVAAAPVTNAAIARAFLVCKNIDPGPVNLQTKPSAEAMLEIRPPEATRSSLYSQFQATRWPLSTIYFSLAWSYEENSLLEMTFDLIAGWKHTSFRIIAPKLVIQRRPLPLIR
jgi:hypothetical protein